MPRRKRLEPIPIATSDTEIGKRIAARRLELGLTQIQLAQSIGLIQSLISAYERGVLRLTADMIIRFANVLSVSADYLLNIDTSEPKAVFPKKLTTRMAGILKLPPATQRYVLQMIDLYLAVGKKQNADPDAESKNQNSEQEQPKKSSIVVSHASTAHLWTSEEREMLKLYYPRLEKKKVLELFPKRNWIECTQEAEALGIKRVVDDEMLHRQKARPRKRGDPRGPVIPWTDDDRLIIRSLYPDGLKRDILARLKHRTWPSIQKEASRLKIRRVVRDDDE